MSPELPSYIPENQIDDPEQEVFPVSQDNLVQKPQPGMPSAQEFNLQDLLAELGDEIKPQVQDTGLSKIESVEQVIDEGELIETGAISTPDDIKKPLQTILGLPLDWDPDSRSDFLLAVNEASGNVIKHGVSGTFEIFLSPKAQEPSKIIVRFTDTGSGLDPSLFHAKQENASFSTKNSLGQGFRIMNETADKVEIASSVSGTTVQLEKWLHPQSGEQAFKQAA